MKNKVVDGAISMGLKVKQFVVHLFERFVVLTFKTNENNI
jgi:hypothetical protein